MDASNRLRNVKGTLYTWAVGLTITGSPELLVDGQPVTIDGAAVRFAVELTGQSLVGVDSQSEHTFRGAVLLIADVFNKAPSADTGVNLYDIDAMVDDLRDAFSLLSLRLKDYTVDPNSPTTLAAPHVLRALGPAQFSPLSPVDGYQRARVTVPVIWDAYHTA